MEPMLAILFFLRAKYGDVVPPEVEPRCVEIAMRAAGALDASLAIVEAFARVDTPVREGTEYGGNGTVVQTAGEIQGNLLVGLTTLALLQNTIRTSFEVLLELHLEDPPIDGRVQALPESIPIEVTVRFQARAVPPTTGFWSYDLFADVAPRRDTAVGSEQFTFVRTSSGGLVSSVGSLLDGGTRSFEDGVHLLDLSGGFEDRLSLAAAEELRPGVYRAYFIADAGIAIENGGEEFPAQIDAFGQGGYSVSIRSLDPNVSIRIAESQEIAPTFQRGDANADDALNISDGIRTLGYLFLGENEPGCLDAADADDSGIVDLTDGVYLFNFLFLGGSPPPSPTPGTCGPDTTEDAIACEEYAPCGA